MRRADHYGSKKRAKRQKRRAKNQKSNAKIREAAITQITAYRKRRARECHFLSNEDIAQRIGLNIATCKAIGVFNRMHDRLPKHLPDIPLVIGPAYSPTTILDLGDVRNPLEGMMPFVIATVDSLKAIPDRSDLRDSFEGMTPMFLLAGAVRRNSHK